VFSSFAFRLKFIQSYSFAFSKIGLNLNKIRESYCNFYNN
jgi:hypothetical protein